MEQMRIDIEIKVLKALDKGIRPPGQELGVTYFNWLAHEAKMTPKMIAVI